MAKVLVDESILSRMADGLRGPFMLSEKMTPSQMADFAEGYAQYIVEKKFSGYRDLSATYVGSYQFQSSPELETVILPNVTTIGTSAFANCAKLTDVQIGSAQNIHASAFAS